jgi:hypothetical protein
VEADLLKQYYASIFAPPHSMNIEVCARPREAILWVAASLILPASLARAGTRAGGHQPPAFLCVSKRSAVESRPPRAALGVGRGVLQSAHFDDASRVIADVRNAGNISVFAANSVDAGVRSAKATLDLADILRFCANAMTLRIVDQILKACQNDHGYALKPRYEAFETNTSFESTSVRWSMSLGRSMCRSTGHGRLRAV